LLSSFGPKQYSTAFVQLKGFIGWCKGRGWLVSGLFAEKREPAGGIPGFFGNRKIVGIGIFLANGKLPFFVPERPLSVTPRGLRLPPHTRGGGCGMTVRWTKWSWLAFTGGLVVAVLAWILFAPEIRALHQ
jgi:hypothetical protein